MSQGRSSGSPPWLWRSLLSFWLPSGVIGEAIRGDLEEAREMFARVTKKIDQVAAKGTLQRNTAARRKSRLARRLNTALAAKTD